MPAPEGMAHAPSPRQNVLGPALVPEPRFPTGRLPVTPVVNGSPVAFVKVTDVGVPRIGVTKVGEVASTIAPVPVVVAAISCFDEFVATATALVGTTAPLTPTTVCELLVPERSPPAVKPLPAAALRTLPLNDRPVPSVIAEGDAELPLEFPNSVEGA